MGTDAALDAGLPVAQAARALGITPGALRKRIRRGSVPAYQQDGQWYVHVVGQARAQASPRDETGAGQGQDAALLAELRAEIEYLRAALRAEQTNMQGLLQRALPAPRPETTLGEEARPSEPSRRRWWWPFD